MFSRRAPFTGRTSGRGFRVRVATNEWMDRRRITEPPPLLPVSPPVIETVLFPGLSWEYRQDFLVCPCCAQVEGGFTLVTLSFSEALYPNRETNYHFDVEKFSFHFNGGSKRFEILFIHVQVSISYYYSISNQHWFRTWLPFYLIPRHESFGFFPTKKKSERREEVLPFRSNSRERRRREWAGLAAFSRASCACALSLGARNALSRMPSYYYGVGHRACSRRISLSQESHRPGKHR